MFANSLIYNRNCLNTTRGNQIYKLVQKDFESLQRSTALQSRAKPISVYKNGIPLFYKLQRKYQSTFLIRIIVFFKDL